MSSSSSSSKHHQKHHPPPPHPPPNMPPPQPPNNMPLSSQAAIENWHVYRAATSSTNAFANPGGATPDDAYADAPTPAETVAYSPPGTPINFTAIDTDDEDVRIAVNALGSMRALSGGSTGSLNHQGSAAAGQGMGVAGAPMSIGSGSSRQPSRNRTTSSASSGTNLSQSSGSHTQSHHNLPQQHQQQHQQQGSKVRTSSQHSGSSGGKQILLGGVPSGISAGASSRSTILGHMPPPLPGPSSMSSSASYTATSSRVSSHFSSSSTMSSAVSTPMSTPATEHTYLSGSGLNAPSLLTADGPAPYRPLRPQASTGDIPFRNAEGGKGKSKDSTLGPITLPQPPALHKQPPSSPMFSSFGSASTALYSAPPPSVSQSRRRNTSAISRMSSTSALSSSHHHNHHQHPAPPLPGSASSGSNSSMMSLAGGKTAGGGGGGIPSIVRGGAGMEDTDMMPPPTSTTSISNSNSRSSISRAASMASLRLKKDEAGTMSLDVARRGGDAFGQTKGSGLRSMLVEAGVTAGGLSAAMSNESMKSLKYCLHWLQYATARIEHQITILRDTMVKLNHGELDLSSPAVQNLTMIKGDVVTTIKGVVDVIGKYAGIALPEQARRSVKAFVLSLPARWASVNRIQTPAPRIAGAGVRRSSFGGSPASPSFGPEFSQQGHGGDLSGSSSALQVHETSQAANRIITLAVESLDILRNVTIVFGESLDRADVWVERLRAVGLRRKRIHEQQELDDAESAEAYALQDQQWYPGGGGMRQGQGQGQGGGGNGQYANQHHLDASYGGQSPSPPPGSVQSGRQLAHSPSHDGNSTHSSSFMLGDTNSPARPAHWELARGAAMVARASSPSAESVVSMATTASSSKRRRTIGSANGVPPPGGGMNRNRSSHSPGDGVLDNGDGYERGSGAGSSQSVGRSRGERLNLSMTPTVRTPAGSDDEGAGGNSAMAYPSNGGGGGGGGYRSARSSISYGEQQQQSRNSLSSPAPHAGKVSPTPIYHHHQQGAPQHGGASFQFKAGGSSSINVGPHHMNATTPAHRRVGITTKGNGGSGSGSSGGRARARSGRASGGNTPASYTQALYPE
ncbi:hypothetical protein CF327_g3557 [Tilletia walkeri]|nr:hypothetical protein CF327_g3557 [Tilletia walkeri]